MLAPAAFSANFGRGSEKNFQTSIRKDDAADVAAFHHNAALFARAALLGDEHLPDAGDYRDFRGRLRDFGGPDGGGHVLAIEKDSLRAALGAQIDARFARELDERVRGVERDSIAQRLYRQGAVHRARVYVH